MPRAINRLSARFVASVSTPGMHADGAGLYLQVAPGRSKSWIFRFTRNGKTRDMGLGPLHTISLAIAREEAQAARRVLLSGEDPIAQRDATKASRARIPTFDEVCAEYIRSHRSGWRNPKHADQWASTLTTYASPKIGTKRVDQIDTDDVLDVVRPIWNSKTETASRVRQRIEAVLSWAAAKRQRSEQNPARWRGHLDHLLPKPSRVRAVQHFAAMPYSALPDFLAQLRKRPGVDARALEFTILTAARTGMVTGACWNEIADDVWTVPKERMKAGREHVVPLSAPALAVLERITPLSPRITGNPLFPGQRQSGLSNAAMDALLDRMDFSHFTVHGFRSSFKDWCAETTSFPNEVSEMALAHVIKDKAEAAYRRGALLKKRRELMEAWASFLAG